MSLRSIQREDADACSTLAFGPRLRLAAERGAHAITIDGGDVASLAGLVREVQAILSAQALDTSDLDAWRASGPDPLARLDSIMDKLESITRQEEP